MNRQQMAELRARLLAKNTAKDDAAKKEAADRLALTAEANVPTIQSEPENKNMSEQNTTEAQLQAEHDAVCNDSECKAPVSFDAGRPPKSRPRRKRHYVGIHRNPAGLFSLLYVDMRVPGVAEWIHTEFNLIPGAFRTRTIAEWYIENASTLPGVKCARDAEKVYIASEALRRESEPGMAL